MTPTAEGRTFQRGGTASANVLWHQNMDFMRIYMHKETRRPCDWSRMARGWLALVNGHTLDSFQLRNYLDQLGFWPHL